MTHFRTLVASIVVTGAMFGVASPALAQGSHVADASALQDALRARTASDVSDRAVIQRVLGSSQAQAVAERFGLDLAQAQSGVATLDEATVAQLATSARAADTQLSGGRSDTIVISVTTLLLVLIVVLLLVR